MIGKRFVVMPSMIIKEIQMKEMHRWGGFTSVSGSFYSSEKVSESKGEAIKIAKALFNAQEERFKKSQLNLERRRKNLKKYFDEA